MRLYNLLKDYLVKMNPSTDNTNSSSSGSGSNSNSNPGNNNNNNQSNNYVNPSQEKGKRKRSSESEPDPVNTRSPSPVNTRSPSPSQEDKNETLKLTSKIIEKIRKRVDEWSANPEAYSEHNVTMSDLGIKCHGKEGQLIKQFAKRYLKKPDADKEEHVIYFCDRVLNHTSKWATIKFYNDHINLNLRPKAGTRKVIGDSILKAIGDLNS